MSTFSHVVPITAVAEAAPQNLLLPAFAEAGAVKAAN